MLWSGNVPAQCFRISGMTLRQAAGPLSSWTARLTDMLTNDRTDSWQGGWVLHLVMGLGFLFTYSLALSASSQLWLVCWWSGSCVWLQRGAETKSEADRDLKMRKVLLTVGANGWSVMKLCNTNTALPWVTIMTFIFWNNPEKLNSESCMPT